MTYSSGSPVRLIAGRIALDFLNTANWSADGDVVQDKIETTADLDVWLAALDLAEAHWTGSVADLHGFRRELRGAFLGGRAPDLSAAFARLAAPTIARPADLRRQSLSGLLAASALSILADPRELSRVKTCPGTDCGWVFLDETKNARRKWCVMELCGNRAKATRHYAKRAKA